MTSLGTTTSTVTRCSESTTKSCLETTSDRLRDTSDPLTTVTAMHQAIYQQGNGVLQASPPAPLARWTRLVSAPAVVQHMTQPKRRSIEALACARRRNEVTSYNGTISTCLHMAH